MGHSRPMHSAPVPINVRCYSNSDMIVRRNEVTLRANHGLVPCKNKDPIRLRPRVAGVISFYISTGMNLPSRYGLWRMTS